ncbi:hypothetical protein [Campylobacter showae]|uniref:hypothetical protein n=1 Tax=Campylobacter showae TaxID=204 RepID=UPI00197F8793|nr:hypothetical protein [Campylobacter showae]
MSTRRVQILASQKHPFAFSSFKSVNLASKNNNLAAITRHRRETRQKFLNFERALKLGFSALRHQISDPAAGKNTPAPRPDQTPPASTAP